MESIEIKQTRAESNPDPRRRLLRGEGKDDRREQEGFGEVYNTEDKIKGVGIGEGATEGPRSNGDSC